MTTLRAVATIEGKRVEVQVVYVTCIHCGALVEGAQFCEQCAHEPTKEATLVCQCAACRVAYRAIVARKGIARGLQ